MHALAESPTLKIHDEGRLSRRTIADAIEVLRSDARFCSTTRSTVRTVPLPLPSGKTPFLLLVVCADVGWAVSLPTSDKFRAKLLHDGRILSKSAKFTGETPLLEGAIVEIVDVPRHPFRRTTFR